ncbi:MAG: hypothetical protein ACPGEG_10700 [Salibacteraceae bacterium]
MSRFKSGAAIKVGNDAFNSVKKIYPRSECTEKLVGGKKTRVGDFTFVPLVDITAYNEEGTISKHGVFTRFQYSFQLPKAADTEGLVDYKRVTWLDSSMRIAEGFGYNDPGVELGLDLPAKQRVLNPGFNGAPASKYADSKAYSQEYLIPVLWGVEIDEEQGVIANDTGEVALLVLTKYQFNLLQAALTKNPPKFIRWYDKDGDVEKYDYDGLGLSVYFEIDTSKKMDSYAFSVSVPAKESHVTDNAQTGTDLLLENFENTRKFEQGYWKFVEQNDAGELSDDECDEQVFAWIANRLLKAWGHELPDNTPASDVIAAFNEISGKYSLAQEAQIGNAIVNEKVIKPKKGKKTSKTESKETDVVDDDNPF